MFIIANHNIQDPDAFWSIIKKAGPEMIPSQLKLHAMFPSTNPMRSVCLWEADSVDAVDRFLQETFGNASKNEVYEVNQEIAIGLPTVAEKAVEGSL